MRKGSFCAHDAAPRQRFCAPFALFTPALPGGAYLFTPATLPPPLPSLPTSPSPSPSQTSLLAAVAAALVAITAIVAVPFSVTGILVSSHHRYSLPLSLPYFPSPSNSLAARGPIDCQDWRLNAVCHASVYARAYTNVNGRWDHIGWRVRARARE
eukprot:6177016-Pleurochrysis_carterae.AAC.2